MVRRIKRMGDNLRGIENNRDNEIPIIEETRLIQR